MIQRPMFGKDIVSKTQVKYYGLHIYYFISKSVRLLLCMPPDGTFVYRLGYRKKILCHYVNVCSFGSNALKMFLC